MYLLLDYMSYFAKEKANTNKLSSLIQKIANYEPAILKEILAKHNIDNHYYDIGFMEPYWARSSNSVNPYVLFSDKKKVIDNIIAIIKFNYERVFTPLKLLQGHYEEYINKLIDCKIGKYKKCSKKKRIRKLTSGQIKYRMKHHDAFSRNIYLIDDFVEYISLKYIAADEPDINLESDYIDFIYLRCRVLTIPEIVNFMNKLCKFYSCSYYVFTANYHELKDVRKNIIINPDTLLINNIYCLGDN